MTQPGPGVDMEKRRVDEPTEVVLVDTPHERKTLHAHLAGDRRPIVAPWLRDKHERHQVMVLVLQNVGGAVAYHLVRIPWYVGKSCFYAPRGAKRLVQRGADALFHAESHPLRAHAVAKLDVDTYRQLHTIRNKHVRKHFPTAVLVLAGVVALAVGIAFGPWWLRWPLTVALVAVLGRAGQPADRPIVQRAVVADGVASKPTSDEIIKALVACRIGGMGTKEAATIIYAHPIRVDGPGWRADIDLPLGVTATDVMENRAGLSSGLRRSIGCVWPEPDPDTHAGRVVLWIGMQDMAKARPTPYPLRKQGVADIFGTLPFVEDQRKRPVGLPLIESNMLIGSLPGAGKTAAVRCVLAGCALDPTTELHVWELKGSGDLESFLRIAHAYGSGVDDDTIEACLNGLRWLLGEVGRRAERLKELRQRSRDLVPDSKVTRDLANRRALGLHPVVFVVDECQELFSHGDHGKEAGDLATAIIKRGRALGVMLILATQRPDKDSLPTGVSANVGTRFCLRVMGQVENDMVLGTSSYKNGVRATMFTKSDRGIGYLVGAQDAPVVGRTYYLDAAATDAIVSRAYLAREKTGLLTGLAAGEQVDSGQVVDFLDDVRTVFGTIDKLWSEDLLERLGKLRPQVYGMWTAGQMAAAFKPHKVTPRDQKIEGTNRNGYRLDWVVEAMTRRELGR